MYDHDVVVKQLLDTGKVDVDTKDTKYGQMPLSWAATGGHNAVVERLLATGNLIYVVSHLKLPNPSGVDQFILEAAPTR